MGSKPMSITSTLPFDIWYYISHFLLDNQLRRLYSVNRAFFHIALSLRYREVSFSGRRGFVGDVNAAKYARILKDPSLGKYVRVLEFDLNSSPYFQGLHPSVPERPSQVWAFAALRARLQALLTPSRGGKTREFEAQVQQIKSFISSLDQLASFSVQWYWSSPTQPSYDVYADIFLLGWSAFGPRLRSLSLRLTTESYLYLFHRGLHFPQLDTLTLELFTFPSLTGDTTTVQSSPEPFLNFIHRHSKALRFLRIISLCPIDRQLLYLGIGHLPALEVLKLEEDRQHQDSSMPALCRFLLLNSATLTEFRWAPKLSPDWATTPTHPTRIQTPLDIHLPKLKKLSLNFKIFRRRSHDLGHILGYISRHARTLTSLSLTGDRLTEPEFHTLLDAVITLQLHTLEVTLHHITLSTFPTVATYLPNLETLVVEYDRFSPDVLGFHDNASSNDYDHPTKITISGQFVKSVQVPSLKAWCLGTLFVKRRGFWHHYHHRRDGVIPGDYMVVRTILENIPRLEYINGMYRQDFLKLGIGSEIRD